MTTLTDRPDVDELEHEYEANVVAAAAGDTAAAGRLRTLRQQLDEARRVSAQATAIQADVSRADAERRARQVAEQREQRIAEIRAEQTQIDRDNLVDKLEVEDRLSDLCAVISRITGRCTRYDGLNSMLSTLGFTGHAAMIEWPQRLTLGDRLVARLHQVLPSTVEPHGGTGREPLARRKTEAQP